MRIMLSVTILFISATSAWGQDWEVGLETGAAWQMRNQVRIPNPEGSRFSLADATTSGPFAFVRLTGQYQWASGHGARFVYAPLRLEEAGQLAAPVDFAGSTFAAGGVTGIYRFDAHRVSYHYRLLERPHWHLKVGATLLRRDAEIALRNDEQYASDANIGFVPLLHVSGRYRWNQVWSFAFDFDGSAAPQGRAVDAGSRLEFALNEHWKGFFGYRLLDGGADNDEVYNFARFNYAAVGGTYRF